MKHKFYLLLLLLAGGLFAGCSSDDDGVTPPDEKDGVLVKVMSYNIYSGQKAYSGKKGMEAIAQVIKKINPDLAGLQEFETKTNKVGYYRPDERSDRNALCFLCQNPRCGWW